MNNLCSCDFVGFGPQAPYYTEDRVEIIKTTPNVCGFYDQDQ